MIEGGMNSAAFAVTHPRGRFVAKAVSSRMREQFVLGLETAARLEAGGIPSAPRINDVMGRRAE
ncbi:hypothetical protein BIV57_13185 [Mangrovactinospora gilvigrisea]|uniref:Aminoglycoside phosphotransferase domain-containing protein n=1 Tax=Mangrovactinospora gilvigrisea TaxID=1428644 RepID=A0A1J7BEC1_9ACTN|nr:hypothetical protein [Mangrovactinospora gilvigrisea]OIV37039.1 hypothetical protein BIV57_13185 [Mangrovactinospora gilvigrisea]